MTGIEHSIIATILLFIFYQAGRYSSKKEVIEEAITNTLVTLEDKGFIVTKELPNGEKELVKVVDNKPNIM